MRTTIEVVVTQDGLHCWPDAPDRLKFLSYPHRHTMVIRARKAVSHDDREIEFYDLAERIRRTLHDLYPDTDGVGAVLFGSASCERIARQLVDALDLDACGVFEDGQHGAWVEKE